MSRKTNFEPSRPYIPKKYVKATAPRNTVRFSRIVLAIIGICLVVALILALLL